MSIQDTNLKMSTVIDFIDQENSDVSLQFKLLSNFERVLKRLPSKLNTFGSKINQYTKELDVKDETDQQHDSNKQDDKQTTGDIYDRLVKEQLRHIVESQSKLIGNSVKMPSKSNDKISQYRKDLLKQIEEKKELKRKQEERNSNQEKFLENKIAQQRLTMYLEFLDERRKKQKNQITKAKILKNGTKKYNSSTSEGRGYDFGARKSKNLQFERISSDRDDTSINVDSFNGDNEKKIITRSFKSKRSLKIDENENEGKNSRNTNISATKFDDKLNSVNDDNSQPSSTSISSDKSILADLNEVRKLMHTDHYELLQKLIELNVNDGDKK
ncbi:hypothetical protein SSS_10747 [Sarcoptes scabiei]|uniref:Uncharacterized protein n=1 Tax=Sarcoptes scabiei TaxID=52283 RepID=A0A834R2X7_SARSC|nr:hypothetical protein SSS_10747 [Sarcoptes scabiei]